MNRLNRSLTKAQHGFRPAKGNFSAALAARLLLIFGCMAAHLGAAGPARGDASSFDLIVAAGRLERNQVPVRVPMPRGSIGSGQMASVTLTAADGRLLPAQWTGPSL